MTFEETAAKIVKENIRMALAVDDELLEPYVVPRRRIDKTRAEESSKLYNSFQKVGCSLEIVRFRGPHRWTQQRKALQQKDLLILDWELKKTDVKFESTLEIIAEAVTIQSLPFICIYTQTPDLSEIVAQIYSYLWERSDPGPIQRQKKDAFLSEVSSKLGSFDEDHFAQFCRRGLEFVCSPLRQNDLRKEVAEQLVAKYTHEGLKIITEAGKTHFEAKNLSDTLLLFELAKDACTKRGMGKVGFRIEPIESREQYSFFVNDALVQIFHKPGVSGGDGETVTPGKLFDRLAQSVYKRPHNFVSLLGLEFRNHFRNGAKNLGKRLNTIGESAFFFHESCVKLDAENSEEFSHFLKDILSSEVAGDWLQHNPSVLAFIESYKTDNNILELLSAIEKAKGSTITEDLAFLNATYSIATSDFTQRRAIRFGDIFETGDDKAPYILCITSRCDCLRPSKINDRFLFVAGKQLPTITAGLWLGDRGYVSFLRREGKNICIEWSGSPFSLHIDSKKVNLAKPIHGIHGAMKLRLKFVCAQKENYTQRIANQAFSVANRVGISFANLSKFETKKPAETV